MAERNVLHREGTWKQQGKQIKLRPSGPTSNQNLQIRARGKKGEGDNHEKCLGTQNGEG